MCRLKPLQASAIQASEKSSVEIAAQFCGERPILRGVRETLYQTASTGAANSHGGKQSPRKSQKSGSLAG
jgi:hypothetical protein